jgi:predicted component of type VI protein secretion system
MRRSIALAARSGSRTWGDRVEVRRLEPGDVVEMGRYELHFPTTSRPVEASAASPGITVQVTEPGSPPFVGHFPSNEVTFGRNSVNELQIARYVFSRRHARVVLRDRKLIIVDLKSTHGVFVDGRRIGSPVVITADSVVKVGEVLLRFSICQQPPSAAPSMPRWLLTPDVDIG